MHSKQDTDVDTSRRKFLTGITAVIGAIGVVGAAYPFVDSMEPSRKALAQGGPIKVDFSKLAPGQIMTVRWRSKPIWILRRTDQQVKELPQNNPRLKDPQSKAPQQLAQYANGYRSLKPEILILVAICTHLGCTPTFRPKPHPQDLGPQWPGGFFCPCHGSRYDLAGRVFDESPAPLNLPVPPYYFIDEKTVHIGTLKGGKDKLWKPKIW